MLNLVASRSSRSLSYPSQVLPRCYHVGKAGSVHTAIQRGLRKSNGQAFRGPAKDLPASDPREKYRAQHGIPKYEQNSMSNSDHGLGRKERKAPEDRGRGLGNSWEQRGKTRTSTSDTDFRIRLGKRLIAGKEQQDGGYAERPAHSGSSHHERDSKFSGRRDRHSDDGTWAFKASKEDNGRSGSYESRNSGYFDPRERGSDDGQRPLKARNEEYRRSSQPGRSYEEQGSKFSGGHQLVSDDTPRQFRDRKESFAMARDLRIRASERSRRDSGLSSIRPDTRTIREHPYSSRSSDRLSQSNEKGRYPSLSFRTRPSDSKFVDSSSTNGRLSDRHTNQFESKSFDRSAKHSNTSSVANTESDGPRLTKTTDNRIPLSIPYTTPASEFLYGTSVVEAALSSRREPRRKLYKLYIYNGENREDPDHDARLERLAKKNGVEVVRAGNEWLRVMDKMSGGRPHNGYILEASPLPRLPITSLGKLTTVEGQDGFEVSVDYQSREEAAVNGTSNFIKIPRIRSGRKPLVLLLDSIVDPGNLGAIIRTASFLGITAIAISSRNSAPFSPVALKASAGASEDITLFMVNKPAGFIVDSKSAGWKVFAAVAPAKKNDPAMPASLSTDQLEDPLSEDPCILMLGSEGEGLRWNLRSKADVDLYIAGSPQNHHVDSLNVSVAAGILCSSFLKRSKSKEIIPIRQEQIEDQRVLEAAKLF
jgi:21S rRNA (GM2251-2'-O)-methyltransferase